MAKIEATASFPEGTDRLASELSVNQILVGKSIASVKFSSYDKIVVTLDSGETVTLEPCGLEGDDLSIVIE